MAGARRAWPEHELCMRLIVIQDGYMYTCSIWGFLVISIIIYFRSTNMSIKASKGVNKVLGQKKGATHIMYMKQRYMSTLNVDNTCS